MVTRWRRTAEMTVGYWALSGSFNAITGELRPHIHGWLILGVALTAAAAALDLIQRGRGPGVRS